MPCTCLPVGWRVTEEQPAQIVDGAGETTPDRQAPRGVPTTPCAALHAFGTGALGSPVWALVAGYRFTSEGHWWYARSTVPVRRWCFWRGFVVASKRSRRNAGVPPRGGGLPRQAEDGGSCDGGPRTQASAARPARPAVRRGAGLPVRAHAAARRHHRHGPTPQWVCDWQASRSATRPRNRHSPPYRSPRCRTPAVRRMRSHAVVYVFFRAACGDDLRPPGVALLSGGVGV